MIVIAALCAISVQMSAECKSINAQWPIASSNEFDELLTSGSVWNYSNNYGSYAKASGGYDVEGWLMTPGADLNGALSVTFSFMHAHKFASDPATELTLWVTPYYTDDPATSTWYQLTIPNYSQQNNWNFVSNSIDVPTDKVGENTVFGFRYRSTSTNHAQWEINNIVLQSMCPGGAEGDTPAGRMRVCAQNVENYYINYDNYESTRANYDHAAFAAKTKKMVNAFLKINADIYALCEVEACPLVLQQLADSLNRYAGKNVYQAVNDGINEAWDPTYDNNIKSGFIYRNDKVTPIRSNVAASSWTYYKNTMRIQAFQEISSEEKLVVSMNHFKSKIGGGDDTRKTNAQHLINALKKSLGDPDILVLGDFNCEIGEEPITMLENAGYVEQLVRFDPQAISHCYGGGELIDHAFANASMQKQIVDAKVYHVCTTCVINNASISYSDHDPYVVDINLGQYQSTGDELGREWKTTSYKVLRNGRIYIVIGEEIYDILGQKMK